MEVVFLVSLSAWRDSYVNPFALVLRAYAFTMSNCFAFWPALEMRMEQMELEIVWTLGEKSDHS